MRYNPEVWEGSPVSLDFRLAHSFAVQRMRRDDLEDLDRVDGEILQIQTIEALLDGCYDGDVTVGELYGRGDFGLGTLTGLDGELVVVDGEFWNIDPEGVAVVAPADAGVPFAALVTFGEAQRFHLDGPMGRDDLERQILDRLEDPEGSYALRVDGVFAPVHFRTVVHQDPPYQPLTEVIASAERQFHAERLEGTMVGFYFPDYASDLNQPGFHFHMVSADRATGGHVYDFTLESADVVIGHNQALHIELPERNLAEVLTMEAGLRSVHIHLVRAGSATPTEMASILDIAHVDAADALRRLANRGLADVNEPSTPDAEPTYRPHLARLRPAHLPPALDDL